MIIRCEIIYLKPEFINKHNKRQQLIYIVDLDSRKRYFVFLFEEMIDKLKPIISEEIYFELEIKSTFYKVVNFSLELIHFKKREINFSYTLPDKIPKLKGFID